LSGHERSCILSGRHRTGQCNCRMRNQSGNPDDETNTRASISRIVMLAEALFEVDLITKLAAVHLTSVFDMILYFTRVYTKINDFFLMFTT
jgi:hypothetical protein